MYATPCSSLPPTASQLTTLTCKQLQLRRCSLWICQPGPAALTTMTTLKEVPKAVQRMKHTCLLGGCGKLDAVSKSMKGSLLTSEQDRCSPP